MGSSAFSGNPVYTADAWTMRCLDCPDQEVAKRVESALRFWATQSLAKWVAENVVTGASERKPVVENSEDMRSAGMAIWGDFCAADGDYTACFMKTESWFADHYRFHMALYDASGDVIWRKRIEELTVPVRPYMGEGLVRYISFRRSTRGWLIERSMANGRVVRRIALPDQARDLDPATCDFLPGVHAGFLVFEGRSRNSRTRREVMVVGVGELSPRPRLPEGPRR
jgi:hypothetical protein